MKIENVRYEKRIDWKFWTLFIGLLIGIAITAWGWYDTITALNEIGWPYEWIQGGVT